MKMTKEQEKAAFLLLESNEYGNPVEILGQYIASYIVSGDLDSATALSFLSAVLKRVDELICGQSEIWSTLLPGGPVESPLFSVVEGDAYDVSTSPITKQWEKPDNIVLEGSFDIFTKGNDVFSAHHGIEFFVDEHQVHWVKFIRGSHSREHYFQLNDIDHIVKVG